uniref:Uncharacterized protein n=1 Tax=Anguilla anguilla TaxID=7936 RepID=A0A0E9VVD2_ANGAN
MEAKYFNKCHVGSTGAPCQYNVLTEQSSDCKKNKLCCYAELY